MDTMKVIDDRVKALSALYKRMDDTKDYLYWEYQLTNFEGEKLSKVVSVTPNQPKVFASSIIADLMGGKWQTVVEGELSKGQSHKIEMFLDDNLAQADEFLLKKFGISSLFARLCNQVCIRGRIGIRWISEVKDDTYKVDCLPVDMRWAPYEFGNDGLKWVAYITRRSKADIEDQYKKQLEERGASVSGTSLIEVRDFHSDEKHEVWVGKQLLIDEKNSLGHPPYIIAISPAGFQLMDEGYLEHEGEDLLFNNRDLYDELARSLSIEQTLGMDILTPPLQYPTKNPDGKPARRAPKSGEVSKVPEGEEFKVVPRGDMNRASMTARMDIQKMIQEGGPVLPRAYTQPPSALEVTTEAELLSKLYNPSKETLRVTWEGLFREVIDQYLKVAKGKSSLLIGVRGHKVQYSPSQLGDPDTYTISCQLMTRNKRQEIANLAMASASKGFLPMKVILRDILQADDPDEIMRQLEIEQARNADPALALFEMALRYAEEGTEIEDEVESDAKKLQSKMLTERGTAIIKQRLAPVPQPELSEEATVPKVEQPKDNIQSLIPLLGQGGMGGGGRGNGGTEGEEVAVE